MFEMLKSVIASSASSPGVARYVRRNVDRIILTNSKITEHLAELEAAEKKDAAPDELKKLADKVLSGLNRVLVFLSNLSRLNLTEAQKTLAELTDGFAEFSKVVLKTAKSGRLDKTTIDKISAIMGEAKSSVEEAEHALLTLMEAKEQHLRGAKVTLRDNLSEQLSMARDVAKKQIEFSRKFHNLAKKSRHMLDEFTKMATVKVEHVVINGKDYYQYGKSEFFQDKSGRWRIRTIGSGAPGVYIKTGAEKNTAVIVNSILPRIALSDATSNLESEYLILIKQVHQLMLNVENLESTITNITQSLHDNVIKVIDGILERKEIALETEIKSGELPSAKGEKIVVSLAAERKRVKGREAELRRTERADIGRVQKDLLYARAKKAVLAAVIAGVAAVSVSSPAKAETLPPVDQPNAVHMVMEHAHGDVHEAVGYAEQSSIEAAKHRQATVEAQERIEEIQQEKKEERALTEASEIIEQSFQTTDHIHFAFDSSSEVLGGANDLYSLAPNMVVSISKLAIESGYYDVVQFVKDTNLQINLTVVGGADPTNRTGNVDYNHHLSGGRAQEYARNLRASFDGTMLEGRVKVQVVPSPRDLNVEEMITVGENFFNNNIDMLDKEQAQTLANLLADYKLNQQEETLRELAHFFRDNNFDKMIGFMRTAEAEAEITFSIASQETPSHKGEKTVVVKIKNKFFDVDLEESEKDGHGALKVKVSSVQLNKAKLQYMQLIKELLELKDHIDKKMRHQSEEGKVIKSKIDHIRAEKKKAEQQLADQVKKAATHQKRRLLEVKIKGLDLQLQRLHEEAKTMEAKLEAENKNDWASLQALYQQMKDVSDVIDELQEKDSAVVKKAIQDMTKAKKSVKAEQSAKDKVYNAKRVKNVRAAVKKDPAKAKKIVANATQSVEDRIAAWEKAMRAGLITKKDLLHDLNQILSFEIIDVEEAVKESILSPKEKSFGQKKIDAARRNLQTVKKSVERAKQINKNQWRLNSMIRKLVEAGKLMDRVWRVFANQ